MSGHDGEFEFILGSRGDRHNLMWPVPYANPHSKGCASWVVNCNFLTHTLNKVTLVQIICTLF